MYKQTLLVTLLLYCCTGLWAQTLPMPGPILKAYRNGTHTADGRPGNNYWQNYGRYNIHVTTNPPDRNIQGTEQITYINNSPDVLKELNMKLIINIHRPETKKYGPNGADYLTTGMQIDTFMVNNQAIQWNNNTASGTNHSITLPKPLVPHDSVKLNIAWHYQISLHSEREGMIDSTTYYLAYFYPRVAVYDDYQGWDKIDFTDFQEFYNDFNDYTLQVTVPKNYLVWSTGTLQNANAVLQPQYAKRLEESFTSDSTIHVATLADVTGKQVTQQNATNTWVWKADHISDMAVGISNHYVWDAASVVVDDATKRRASMQAAFLDNSEDFHHSVQFGRNSLSWLSHNWPGVPYPFPKMTAFQGFADMEYPMMVNDNSQKDLHFGQFVQDHEIAHTYFPFYMGINESRYAYMDEGWATTFELLIGRTELGNEKAEAFYKKFRVERWINNIGKFTDKPVITPSDEQLQTYGDNAYGKPSLSYLALKDMLGDDLFKKCLHEYMDRWNGKHPIPWDYFNTMSDASGRNLNWFFNNWFFNNSYIDLAVNKVIKSDKGYQLVIDNIGGYAIPFDVQITHSDGSTGILHITPGVWKGNQKRAAIELKGDKVINRIKLDGGIFMDANERDNVWNGN